MTTYIPIYIHGSDFYNQEILGLCNNINEAYQQLCNALLKNMCISCFDDFVKYGSYLDITNKCKIQNYYYNNKEQYKIKGTELFLRDALNNMKLSICDLNYSLDVFTGCNGNPDQVIISIFNQ